MQFRLPIPSSWQNFEEMCHQLWKEIWCDPNAQRNGRAGQPQHGVDIFGRPIYMSTYSGVQCKDKDGRLGSKLKENELIAECHKAKLFRPELQMFSLATTSSRDVVIQSVARTINKNSQFPFDVHVWSWDDIEAEIVCRPNLIKAFYGSLPIDQESMTIKIAVSAPRDQFLAFFTRPQIERNISYRLRQYVISALYELSDNAFLHGMARHVQLSFEGSSLIIEDDGKAFNPLTELDAKKAKPSGNLGSFVFETFIQTYADKIQLSYVRYEGNPGRNKLTITFNEVFKLVDIPEVLDLPINLSEAFGRRGAEGLAQSLPIPIGVREVVLTVSCVFNISALAMFITCVRARLPETVLLTVSHPRDNMISALAIMFQNEHVRFQSR